MESSEENNQGLEQMLESLIKMVGKTNQKMDNLQTRVTQLEWLIKEQLRPGDRSRIKICHGILNERRGNLLKDL
ncbi:hypothetical protein HPT25_06500 [Bacillus sp. BRMEA1]|uniref:hypothetical protein n=1 Tax=Neobacillus endophyticus TaxID=2738405 RepID=UPI00156699F3|nr:hypothetical protein [Neobacillus endophyticus]NRD77145.1 hypothetical protein [Neobacillus endophyticus]